ncbi:MAG: UvrB/UvrC motif-containing protein [Pirellulaceae bacterium]|jgi:protein arginine kinase activator|nr:UvrB/UvrC motif-containing protein [Pirellulaceae bacterium]
MKCQHCEKPAIIHITELTDDVPVELHFCEEHARAYLTQSEAEEQPAPGTTMAGGLAQQVKVGKTAEDLARLDQRTCPVCGVTFYEFRHAGRLGCPHDYVCFRQELEPLIVNIHGATEHKGKRPQHSAHGTDQQTRLIQLRREMREAVQQEDYERASRLRDEIRRIERPSGA